MLFLNGRKCRAFGSYGVHLGSRDGHELSGFGPNEHQLPHVFRHGPSVPADLISLEVFIMVEVERSSCRRLRPHLNENLVLGPVVEAGEVQRVFAVLVVAHRGEAAQDLLLLEVVQGLERAPVQLRRGGGGRAGLEVLLNLVRGHGQRLRRQLNGGHLASRELQRGTPFKCLLREGRPAGLSHLGLELVVAGLKRDGRREQNLLLSRASGLGNQDGADERLPGILGRKGTLKNLVVVLTRHPGLVHHDARRGGRGRRPGRGICGPRRRRRRGHSEGQRLGARDGGTNESDVGGEGGYRDDRLGAIFSDDDLLVLFWTAGFLGILGATRQN
jgi:hypothetical protein